MRRLAQVATIQVLLAGSAAADRQSVTFSGVQIDLESPRRLALTREANGIVVRAQRMPSIWFGVYGEDCSPNYQTIQLPRPAGFFVVNNSPAVSPWPRDSSWSALCIEGGGVTLHVLVQYFDHVGDSISNEHVQAVLGSISRSLRPPIEIAPGVVYEQESAGPLLKRGGRPNELLYAPWSLEISLDAASCRDLPTLPAGTRRDCRELPDRAAVVTYREAPAPGGEAPAPDTAIAPMPPSPYLEHFARRLADAIEAKYGSASWVERNFRPKWANGEIPLPKLPSGTWKLSDRGDTFELHEIRSRSHIRVSRASCGRFWASPPAGRRVEAPAFLPATARAAVVDERERWVSVSCFEMLGADVTVTIDLPREPDDVTARALAHALTEVANALRYVVSGAVLANKTSYGSFGLSFEGWLVWRVSVLAQLERIEHPGDGVGHLEALRIAVGVGAGFSRPHLRAAVHAGFGIEGPPMAGRAGEDHIGGSVFIDARAIAGAGWLVAQGIMRGAIYFGLGCTQGDDPDKSCAGIDSSNHTPRRGWEIEGRVGLTPRGKGRKIGGYGGVRYFVTWAEDRVEERVEHGALVTLGGLGW